MNSELKAMRDVFIEQIFRHMHKDKSIFFLCADFGSPKLDKLRVKFKERFVNVGIAEQNLINIATGLALEGFTVYAYAIAPFLTMRAYEQIRVNLSLQAQLKGINVNLIGVGAGLSYDVSGPTHHCLEDISVIRTLPNIVVFSPSDWVLAEKFLDYSVNIKTPKYLRFDSKPLPEIYSGTKGLKIKDGLYELIKGKDVGLVSTGYMTHTALKAADILNRKNIKAGVIDVFLLKPFNEKLFLKTAGKYNIIITLEEGFINKGGLDSLILNALVKSEKMPKFRSMGFADSHVFDIGSREYLHKINRIDALSIVKNARQILREA